MRVLDRILHIVDSISEWSGKIVSFGIWPLMLMIVYDVMARYIFRAPTHWAGEAATLIFGVCWVTAGAYALLQGSHVKMEVFYARLSLRKRAILDVITAPLFFAFIGTVMWQGARFALISIGNLETSPSLWAPPIYPIKVFIPLGAFLLLLQGVAKLIRDLKVASGKGGEV